MIECTSGTLTLLQPMIVILSCRTGIRTRELVVQLDIAIAETVRCWAVHARVIHSGTFCMSVDQVLAMQKRDWHWRRDERGKEHAPMSRLAL